jgi:hypothetical protein
MKQKIQASNDMDLTLRALQQKCKRIKEQCGFSLERILIKKQ